MKNIQAVHYQLSIVFMRPLIIGHRGASAVAPENTLAAFRRAVEDGADGIEFDVRLSADDVPVVIHDADLQRTGANNALVREMSSKELQATDVGSWFNRRFPERARDEYAREGMPTLEDVLRMLNVDLILYIEMKCLPGEAHTLANRVTHLLREYDLVKRVVVESFTHEAIIAVKQIFQEIKTAALFEPSLMRPRPSVKRIIQRSLEVRADEIALASSLVNRRSVEAARHAELPVVVWTVDTRRWARRAFSYNLRAVICNHPAQMRKYFQDLELSA
jgi:glycerophosphoryl diester phosphodiesterase